MTDTGRPTYEEASRFLSQASFGPTEAMVADVRRQGLEDWFLSQVALPRRDMLARFQAASAFNRHMVYPLFWEGAVRGADQLRQRVAYALSQIVVISLGEMGRWPDLFVVYAGHLEEQAFGNYGALLRQITYAPAMGLYLSHLGNEKADPDTGAAPDENYARELMQLFTIGVVPLTPGGEALPGETYGPEDVEGLAAIMTGLSWSGLDRWRGGRMPEGDPRRLRPMDAYPVAHEQRAKRFLGYEAEGPNPIEAIDGALAHLMDHPNTAPFVCRRLIQALVTASPAPEYVARVGRAFATGRYALPSGRAVGAGERGDMTATVAAILFDEAARRPARLTAPAFGRPREATLRFAHLIRAFAGDWSPGPEPERVGFLSYSHQQSGFAEQPWYAPSVFGAFKADYAVPGSEGAAAGLVAPELQAQNAASTLGYLSRLASLVRDPLPGPLVMDLSPLEEAVRDGVPATVDLIERVFFHGAMPQDTREKFSSLLGRFADGKAWPIADRTADKMMQLTLAAAMTDPGFAIQR